MEYDGGCYETKLGCATVETILSQGFPQGMSNAEESWRALQLKRHERWDLIEELVKSVRDPDDLLADIMNLATVLYVMRREETQPVHKPFGGDIQ